MISERPNGDWLTGIAGPLAQDLCAVDTPRMHGFAMWPRPSTRVSGIRTGDPLRAERNWDHWEIRDEVDLLNALR